MAKIIEAHEVQAGDEVLVFINRKAREEAVVVSVEYEDGAGAVFLELAVKRNGEWFDLTLDFEVDDAIILMKRD